MHACRSTLEDPTTVERQIDADLPPCSGDLIRTDRSIAIVLRTLVGLLDRGGSITLRAFADEAAVVLDVGTSGIEPTALIDTFTAADPPLVLGDSLGPRLARGWIEAQGGTVAASVEASVFRVRLRVPRSSD